MVLGSRHASGDVGKDEIIPAVERDEAVGCSEVDAYFPFILADLIADAEGGLRVSDAHGSLLLAEVCKSYIHRTVRAIKRLFKRCPMWVRSGNHDRLNSASALPLKAEVEVAASKVCCWPQPAVSRCCNGCTQRPVLRSPRRRGRAASAALRRIRNSMSC